MVLRLVKPPRCFSTVYGMNFKIEIIAIVKRLSDNLMKVWGRVGAEIYSCMQYQPCFKVGTAVLICCCKVVTI